MIFDEKKRNLFSSEFFNFPAFFRAESPPLMTTLTQEDGTTKDTE
jgi:hypothetical protein